MKPKNSAFKWLSVCCGAEPKDELCIFWFRLKPDGQSAKMANGWCVKCGTYTTFEQADEEGD